MPLWLLLVPRIADIAISRGVQEVKTLEQKKTIGNFWITRMGGLEQMGRWADGGRQGVDRRTAAGEQTGGGWGGGRADGRT